MRGVRCRPMVVGALALLATAGCTSPGAYWRSRGADLLDVVPMSIAHGWGIGISAQATPLLQVGLGITPIVSQRYGYDDRYIHGIWNEYQAGFPWSMFVADLDAIGLVSVPDRPRHIGFFEGGGITLLYRWQVLRDAPSGEGERNGYYEPNITSWGRHPPLTRESMGALIIPGARRWLEFHDLRLEQGDDDLTAVLGSPMRATLWGTTREGVPASRAWDLFELDAFLGPIGARIGVRPIEFVDFVLGIFFLDPLLDDLPTPIEFEPRPRDAEVPSDG
ncbi:MAG: hypothetical protein H6825_03705 [Planctomycetes bacterium]|nr:hypothetical protein [Planctomycetota bacterium]